MTGAAGAAIRERYRRRITLLPPGIYRPDRQQNPSASCLKRYVVSVVRAVLTSRSLPSSAATVRRSMKLTPFTTFGVSQRASTDRPPAVCGDFGGKVLHRWRRDTIHRAALVAVKVRPVIHDGFFFRQTCRTAVMAYVPSSFSRILTQRNRRWRSVGSFSPHTLVSATPSGTRLTFTFMPSVTD